MLIFCVLQISFVFIVLTLGCWLSGKIFHSEGLNRIYWIDRASMGAGLIILLFVIVGIIVYFLPWEFRQLFSQIFMTGLFVLCAALVFVKKADNGFINASQTEKIFLYGVILMSIMGLAVSLLPVKLPEQLVDGPYVSKHDSLGVRVQYITGNLPTDNSLPHVVSEYFLRDISFVNERPVMPGQELSNRPVLVSLLLVPFRAALAMPEKMADGLPDFVYAGTAWPDFSILMIDDHDYLYSLSLGIVLNSLILLGLGSMAVRAQVSPVAAVALIALTLTSPYFLFQTIFTWPKELAAFFLIYSLILLCQLNKPKLAGLFIGMGYLSHPYIIVFVFGLFLRWLYKSILHVKNNLSRKKMLQSDDNEAESRSRSTTMNLSINKLIFNQDTRDYISFMVVFILTVSPWFIWSRLILNIPSDLVTQNLFISGQALIDFFWIRPVNLFNTLMPMHLVQYPFSLSGFLIGSMVNIPGALGLIIGIFSLKYLFDKKPGVDQVFQIYIPVMLLIFIFSNQAVPALHGLNGPIAMTLLAGINYMYNSLKPGHFVFLTATQVITNVLLLGAYLGTLL